MKFKKLTALLFVMMVVFLTACSSNQIQTETTSSITSTIITEEQQTTTNNAVTKHKSTAKSETSTTKKIEASTSKKTCTTKPALPKDKKIPKSTTKAKKEETTEKEKQTTKKTSSEKHTNNNPTQSTSYCKLTIECSAILDNMDKLKEGHSTYVPKDGYILNNCKIEYSEGDTAYDILKKGCEKNSIKINATTTSYGIYVAGINNLDEMDCGKQSGWLYSVNSTFPNVSCGKQNVKPGDEILFKYTC